jgi:signal transduction histidine kinase
MQRPRGHGAVSTTKLSYEELMDRLTNSENQLACVKRQCDEAVALVKQQANELREINWELSQVTRRERRNLARILHDHLQQLLVAARFKLSTLKRHLPDDAARQILQQVDSLLNDSIEETRELTTRLTPMELSEGDLTASLQWLAQYMRKMFGLRVELMLEAAAEPAAEDARELLFQAAREMLFNVVKHAQVNTAYVELRQSADDQVQMVVRDSGKGFDVKALACENVSSQSFGLASVCRPLERMGGRVEIDAAPGRGTQIVISVPCQRMLASNPSWRLAD